MDIRTAFLSLGLAAVMTAACARTADAPTRMPVDEKEGLVSSADQATAPSPDVVGQLEGQIFDIKSALMADTTIEASEIRVYSDSKLRTVALAGRVATEAQRATADKIARARAPGWTVKNELTVSR